VTLGEHYYHATAAYVCTWINMDVISRLAKKQAASKNKIKVVMAVSKKHACAIKAEMLV
jgi:hypothetical protein